MAKGQAKPLNGFSQLDRIAAVAALGKKVARVVSGVPQDVANDALRAAMRPESLVPIVPADVVPSPDSAG